jgi:diguanylate cyclase (GGDEF)-like protein
MVGMMTFKTISHQTEKSEKMQLQDQSKDVPVDKGSSRSELIELLAVIFASALSTLLMIHLEAFDKLYRYSRMMERYEFDEIAVFLPSFLAIGFVLYSYRRIQKLEYEMIRRREMERQLLKSEKLFKSLSITDDLTQLYNSRYFYKRLKEEINKLIRHKQPLSLLLIDIDDFKKINDRYGHLQGDNFLKKAGSVIQNCLRKTDSAYRYGGEEFTIILPGTGIEAAINVAKRIRKGFVAQDFSSITNETLHMSVSIGACQFKPEEDMEAFVKRTDDALYRAKRSGKNRVHPS